MAHTVLAVDVYCNTAQNGTPAYRVYVDNDLLTERNWLWPTWEIYIEENIEVDLESGNHKVYIESCGADSSFTCKNLRVNGVAADLQDLTFST